MKDMEKTKEQLIVELEEIRQRTAQLEAAEREGQLGREGTQSSEEEFRNLIDNLPVGISVATLDGRATERNRALQKMLGYDSKEELMKAPVLAHYYNPEDRKHFIELIKKQGHVEDFEVQLKRKDGTPFWTSLTSMPHTTYVGNQVITVIQDITEKKVAKGELQLRARLLDAVSDSITVRDFDGESLGNIVYLNEATHKSHGYTRDEFIKMRMEDIDTTESANLAAIRLAELMEKGEITYEETHRRKDNSIMSVEVHASIVRIDGRQVRLSVIRDITERKQAEEELSLRATLLDAATDSIYLLDLDGNYIYANEAYRRARGYSKEDTMKMNLRDVIDPERVRNIAPRTREIVKKRELSWENVSRRKDGSTFPVEINGRHIRLNDKSYILQIARDITERKKAEGELKLRAELLDLATDAVFLRDVGGNFIYVNEAAQKLYGYEREEFLRMSFDNLIPPERTHLIEVRIKEILEKDESIFEAIHLHKDKSQLQVEVHARSMNLGGHNFLLSVVRDISERKQVEKALRTSEEKYRNLVENLPVGIAFNTLDGQSSERNRALQEMYGYESREEFMNIPVQELYYDPEDRKRFLELIKKQGYVKGFEMQRKRKDGTPFWASLTSIPQRDESEEQLLTVIEDISERKIAAEITQNLAKFPSENPSPVLRITNDGIIQYANKASVPLMNIWKCHIGKRIPADWQKLISDALTTGSRKQVETEYDKTILALILAPIVEAGYVNIYGLDITERKEAEEELNLRAELLNTATDAIFVEDLDGNIVYANEAMCKSRGYAKEEIMNINLRDLVASEFVEQIPSRFENIVGKGELTFEGRALRKDKSSFPVEAHARTVILGDQTLIISVVRDITRRKRAREELQLRAELLDLASDSIYLLDMDGNFVYANEAYFKSRGYSREAVMKMNIRDLVVQERGPHITSRIEEIVETGEIFFESTNICKDKSVFPVEVYARVIKRDGQNLILNAVRDITERKRMEEERQRAARLESIGTLAGGIAHDFNNILTAILGNISLAKSYAESKSKEEVNERLEEAEKASLRARDLIRQLLTFSRGGAPVKKLTSVGTLINDSATFALRGSNVNHSLSIPSNLWTAEVDEGQMSQLIHNLVINADQAMPQGGTINIKAKKTIIRKKSTLPLPKGRYIEVIVEDQGVGIPKEHLDRIFDPYFTTKQKGSGLGLATCYSIIKNHGGHIMVNSIPSRGTTFRIYLPASGKAVMKKKEVAKAPVTGEGRILVMDDEMPIRGLLDRLLTGIGYTVELVSDGSDAIKAYQKAKEAGKPFDAVILDLTVPGAMGGKDAMRELLEIDPDVKAVVSSGYATDPIMSEYTKYGFSAVITKPYKVEELEQTLYRALAGTEKK